MASVSTPQPIKSARHRIIVLGAGPAGVSAALGFAEARVDVLVIERSGSCGGQLNDIPSPVENITPLYENGAEVRKDLEAAFARALATGHVKLIEADIGAVEKRSDITLISESGHFTCEYLVVAAGQRVRKLDFEPASLSNYVYCNTPQFAGGESVAVVGGGDSALLKALKLAEKLKQVHIIHRSDKLRARPDVIKDVEDKANIEVHLQKKVARLLGGSTLTGIRIESTAGVGGLELDVCAVIVKAGYVPNSECLPRDMLDEHGYVKVDARLETDCGNIFACGDIVSGNYPRIATAYGQGMAAAGRIIERIFEAEHKRKSV